MQDLKKSAAETAYCCNLVALQASAGQRLLARQQAAGGGSSSQQGDLYRRDGSSGSPAQRQAGSR
jgi:hypothetical protein